jgi:hypothetical protein
LDDDEQRESEVEGEVEGEVDGEEEAEEEGDGPMCSPVLIRFTNDLLPPFFSRTFSSPSITLE